MTQLLLLLIFLAAAAAPAAADTPLVVGSKKFTESLLLGEIACDLARSSGTPTIHLRELGGTRILWDALLAGSIDLYPEYTGTLRHEILAGEAVADDAALASALARRGLRISRPLGFGDTYALGMLPDTAARLQIGKIGDLVRHPEIRFGLSSEFLNRGDGWPGLRDSYGLAGRASVGLDHDLAYRALADHAVDVIDLYSTDAEIAARHLTILADDRSYFPAYDAVIIYRADAALHHPAALAAILRLEGAVSQGAMIAMNAQARLDHEPETTIAAQFAAQHFGVTAIDAEPGLTTRVLGRTREHLLLTLISLTAAIIVAVPLGILAAHRPRLGRAILAATGIVQTIPSLALLVVMIPLLGIGARPAIAALFLYGLLPILRNTVTGLQGIAPPLRQAAIALGLTPWRRLVRVELPLAMPAILAGIKTAAVIDIGTATLGALVGAGGYGQPILTGIRLDDTALILEGAVPAALLALLVEALFDLAGTALIARGLRPPRAGNL